MRVDSACEARKKPVTFQGVMDEISRLCGNDIIGKGNDDCCSKLDILKSLILLGDEMKDCMAIAEQYADGKASVNDISVRLVKISHAVAVVWHDIKFERVSVPANDAHVKWEGFNGNNDLVYRSSDGCRTAHVDCKYSSKVLNDGGEMSVGDVKDTVKAFHAVSVKVPIEGVGCDKATVTGKKKIGRPRKNK